MLLHLTGKTIASIECSDDNKSWHNTTPNSLKLKLNFNSWYRYTQQALTPAATTYSAYTVLLPWPHPSDLAELLVAQSYFLINAIQISHLSTRMNSPSKTVNRKWDVLKPKKPLCCRVDTMPPHCLDLLLSLYPLLCFHLYLYLSWMWTYWIWRKKYILNYVLQPDQSICSLPMALIVLGQACVAVHILTYIDKLTSWAYGVSKIHLYSCQGTFEQCSTVYCSLIYAMCSTCMTNHAHYWLPINQLTYFQIGAHTFCICTGPSRSFWI